MKRRKFIQNTAMTGIGVSMAAASMACGERTSNNTTNKNQAMNTSKITNPNLKPLPTAICTWKFTKANEAAGKLLSEGADALTAAIAGCQVEEENLKNTTVGKGGAPDREGNVTLDACVMNSEGDCGAVVCVSTITNVAALARKVMEETPHVILAAEGAEAFGYTQGFRKEELLTDDSKKAWEEWLKTSQYKPIINIENHDTIGMLAMDVNGDIAGACSSSGLSYKMKGRVGDSPIIGSGLFIDNEIGGAVATGMGEEVIKTVGSFLIVELMRNGMSPQKACEEAIQRVVAKNINYKDFQVAYIAINKKGETGSYCIHEGFTMMKYQNGTNEAIKSHFYKK